jgi:putative ABC transport system permease protein
MWGNVPVLLGMIGSAVLFAAFMIALNTMLLDVRERRLEVGVLKALGFPPLSIFLVFATEGLLVCGAGGLAGAYGARAVFNWMGVDVLYKFFPAFMITDETMTLAIGTALAVGVVSGIVPALIAVRLSVMDALARLG